MASEAFFKTPSRIAYAHGTNNVKSWGIFVEFGDPTTEIKEYFKLYLDPEFAEFQGMSHREAKRLYLDYLTCVHDHVVRSFKNWYPRWATMRVEWLFSVPTTWKHAGMLRDLLAVIKQAGFGGGGPYHTCDVTLTEAEAAAVDVGKQMLQVWSQTLRKMADTK